MSTKSLWAAVVACVAAFGVAACGSSNDSGGGGSGSGSGLNPPKLAVQQSVGQGEGQLNIIAWAGYAEDGSTDPKVDWVTPFEKQTGCQVNVKVGNTSDEMVTLMRTGRYDGVSASGDATLRLIAGGDVAPVNTDLVPNYADVCRAALKNKPWNSVDGPDVRHPARLRREPADVEPERSSAAPTRWGAVFDPTSSPEQGQGHGVRQPDLHRRRGAVPQGHQPDLKITNPYELDHKQFDAAVDLLKQQRKIHRRVLVRLHQGAGGVRQRQLDGRHDVAGHRQPARGRQGHGQDRRCPRRARPAGRTPG